jgi:hypothetical protein
MKVKKKMHSEPHSFSFGLHARVVDAREKRDRKPS